MSKHEPLNFMGFMHMLYYESVSSAYLTHKKCRGIVSDICHVLEVLLVEIFRELRFLNSVIIRLFSLLASVYKLVLCRESGCHTLHTA